MALLIIASAVIGIIVIGLLLVEYYQQPFLAIAAVAIGFWLILWAVIEAAKEWKRG